MTALEWATTKLPTDPPAEFHCKTIDVWLGRFSKIAPLLIRQGADPKFAALIAAVIGELGDNCFAHNSPNWIDLPGCWFQWSVNVGILHCVIADRGRGLLTSLKAVRHELHTDREALQVALTERVSGRAPEKRGNGLKFAVEALHNLVGDLFLFQSGTARMSAILPLDPSRIEAYIWEAEMSLRGVYIELNVQMNYAN